MTDTELIAVKPVAQADFIVTTSPEKIKGLQERYKSLTLKGTEYRDGKVVIVDSLAMLADKQGLQLVTEARKDAMKHRTRCAAEHQKLKEDAKAECDRLDKWKRDCTALIVEVEDKFKAMEKAVEDEIIAIETREMDKRQSEREAMIANVGGIPLVIRSTMNPNFIRVAMEEQFDEWLSLVKSTNEQAAESERLRKAKEESDRIEAKRLADEKAESDRLAAVEAENQRKENQRIAVENLALKKELDEREAELNRVSIATNPVPQAHPPIPEELMRDIVVGQSRTMRVSAVTGAYMKPSVPAVAENALQRDKDSLASFIRIMESLMIPTFTSYFKSYAEAELKITIGNAIGRLNGLLEKMNSKTTEEM